jgi:hypothetical protein
MEISSVIPLGKQVPGGTGGQIFNLPGYGPVNVILTPLPTDPKPASQMIYKSSNEAAAANQTVGNYNWSTNTDNIGVYNTTSDSSFIEYFATFQFKNGLPAQNALMLVIIGIADTTTATASQPLNPPVELALTGTGGLITSPTVLDPTKLIISSGYSSSSRIPTDQQNTGWALFQTLSLSPVKIDAVTGFPTLSVGFRQKPGDGIGFTLGYAQFDGLLKVCKVAGLGVAAGSSFSFTAGSGPPFTVPAGTAPGGACVIGPSFPVGTSVTLTEKIPVGDAVSSITVAPPSQLVSTNLATGTVNLTIGSGVTEVTYTDQKPTGYLEICKQGSLPAPINFTFKVNPGNLGPFIVPAGACSPAIEVAAGQVVITETPTGRIVMSKCGTIPASQQVSCNPSAGTSTVNVAPGDVSTQTVAIITNK